MPRPLTITPAPFKSSYLAIPPSPFSPQLPISPPASPAPKRTSKLEQAERLKAQLKSTAELLPPPASPLHWLWQCHKCNRVYQLGVTRRCLDDGHLFCAGTTTVKKGRGKDGRVVRRHAACASEFDYQGWKGWGIWRRSISAQVEAADALLRAEEAFESALQDDQESSPVVPNEAKWLNGAWAKKAVHARSPSANVRAGREYWEKSQAAVEKREQKNCLERCDYPSECRWGKQFGVQTPTTLVASLTPAAAEAPGSAADDQDHVAEPKTSFEDILLELSQSAMGTSSTRDITDVTIAAEDKDVTPPPPPPPPPAYLERLSPTRSQRQKSVTEAETPIVSMDDLLESVKRRKRRSSGHMPSPLGAHPPSPTTSGSAEAAAPVEIPASARAHLPKKALDDFDITWGTATLQAKAEGLVKSLVIKTKKRRDTTQACSGAV